MSYHLGRVKQSQLILINRITSNLIDTRIKIGDLKRDINNKMEHLDVQKEYAHRNNLLIENINSILKFNVDLINFLNKINDTINNYINIIINNKSRSEILVMIEKLLLDFINCYGEVNTRNWFL